MEAPHLAWGGGHKSGEGLAETAKEITGVSLTDSRSRCPQNLLQTDTSIRQPLCSPENQDSVPETGLPREVLPRELCEVPLTQMNSGVEEEAVRLSHICVKSPGTAERGFAQSKARVRWCECHMTKW